MNHVPQPVCGSVGVVLPVAPNGLSPGLYLDEDVALSVSSQGLVVIAPNSKRVELVVASVKHTVWEWKDYRISEEVLRDRFDAYAAWLDLVAKFSTVGGLHNESQESSHRDQPVYLEAS